MSEDRSRTFAAHIERIALTCMALGVASMLQPWWSGGLRAGFFATLAATVVQIVSSHWPESETGARADAREDRA